jgi:alkylated DNA repair dioxygenase AlkB
MKKQGELFGISQNLPRGFVYQPEFISEVEETALLEEISVLPLHEAKYKEYTAKRRVIAYGGSYDFATNELVPAGGIPPFLKDLRERIAEWTTVPASQFTHAVIAEYKTGTQLGWHRDVPQFEFVVGVSLGGACRMRLRPYPPNKSKSAATVSIDLEPRSAYQIRGEARWGWQHSIPPTKTTRFSITFRTLR